MYNIDDYDLKILTLLQANGRLTNQELERAYRPVRFPVFAPPYRP